MHNTLLPLGVIILSRWAELASINVLERRMARCPVDEYCRISSLI